MDAYSSGEELVIKTRKPYTITKQRERWTEEEHNRFLEALKLHGRAWQRIEEHIGTKTAVQIRSHAQKFFSKLEKKALAKGVPTGQSLDIEIPPPRPKRKPSNPYPRKTSAATLVQMGMKHGKSETPPSFLRCKQVLDLEKEPLPERPNEDEKSSNLQENQDGSCSEVFTHIHEANCSSVSLVNKNSMPTPAAIRTSCTFREFVPSLKENPAAHATASFAATFWPYANVRHSADSPTCDQGGFPSRQMNSATSMAGIAAATVAAATTWWAAHGMLSLCAPLHTGCTCAPAFAGTVPPVESDQAPSAKTGGKNNADQDLSMQNQQLDHGYSEVMQGQHSASKSPTSSSDCEESGDAKVNIDVKDAGVTEPQDANKTNKKQVDRSSSDSNSPCSEMEIDVLEKHEKDKEDPEEADVNHPQAECNSRRGRSSMNLSDSWKEVSEGGRLAFQALFSREVLPQSFSPPHDGKNKEQKKENIGEDKQNADENNGETSTLHLTSQASRSCSDHREVENNALSKAKNIVEKSQPTIELGHEKLKGRQTGFKPYKRCSVEAKESRMMNTGSQGEGKDPKRIRLEGEASTYLSYSAFN
ncbi:protein LATE ELONGATED HYPOCOTYL-like isoform X5 [Hibiscus syriacus]|uniref:protein LATE ELONGATED HYPOCOTYL-like isoform X5 n=1 Tax=Hibiscus syriacus TaxID=106335 RepID=UPI0019223172|nr:protein LATE ELONGATED HYPOCOTYL-like isoform X5 [Hibiscus syriacus]